MSALEAHGRLVTVKRVLRAFIIVFILLLLTTAISWFTLSDQFLLGLIRHQIESATDMNISYESPARITRGLSPELSVTNLAISTKDNRFQFQTHSLNVRINLVRLLIGQLDVDRLWLGQTRVEVHHSKISSSTKPGKSNFAIPKLPVLHDLRIAQLSFIRNGVASQLPNIAIEELTLQPNTNPARLVMSAKLRISDNPIDIEATLGLHVHNSNSPVPFTLSLLNENLNLMAQGSLDLSQASPSIDATLQGNVNDLSRYRIAPGNLTIPGEMTLNAHLVGSLDHMSMEKLSANWHDSTTSTASLNGRIDNLRALSGFDLTLATKLVKPGWLIPLLPDSVGELKSADGTAQISGDYPQLGVRALHFTATDIHQLDITLSGQVDITKGTEGPALENMKMELGFTAPTTRAARVLIFDKVPELGAVTGHTQVVSSKGDPALEDLVVKTKDPKGIDVMLKGRIARFPLNANPNEGYALDVHMRARATSLMGDRLGMSLPLKGPMNLKFRIEGGTQDLKLNRIALVAGKKKTLQVSASGRIAFGPWDKDDPLEIIDLKLRADSADTASLGTLIKQQLPELGALSARAHLHTISGQHRLDDFHLTATESAALQITLDGSAQKLIFVPKPAVDDIRLKLAISGDDASVLNKVFGWGQRIPVIGPLRADATIAGTDRELRISDVDINAGQRDILRVEAHGSLGSLSAANQWRPRDADIRVNVASSDSHAFAKSLGYAFPVLGPLSGHAHIHEKDKHLSLDSAKLWIGDEATPQLQLNGMIGDLFAMRKIMANINLNIDSQHLARFMDNPKLAELNPLKGNIVISDSDDSLGIDNLHLESTHPHMNLRVDGQFSDFKNPSTLTLRSHMDAQDMQILASLYDMNWNPDGAVQFDSQIRNGTDGVIINASLSAGKLAVSTNLVAQFDSNPPRVRGVINANNFFFPELINKQKKAKNAPVSSGPVFSTTPIDFSPLRKLDMDLAVDINSFDPDRTDLDAATMKITLKSGELSFSDAKMIYPIGKIDFDAELNTTGTPQFHFKANGQNINPWRTLDMQQSSGQTDINADVDIALELKASGVSEHELASSLDGEIYITTTNGKLRKSLIDLVFVDLIGWTAGKVSDDKYAIINCGVADYSIHHGKISTNGLFMDTDRISITGDGDIDLGKEQIDYVIIPRKKSRLILKAEPVKIQGPLSNPSVKVIPWKSAAVTYGSLIFAPYIFVGVTAADFLFGEFSDDSTESPCRNYEKTHKLKNKTPTP